MRILIVLLLIINIFRTYSSDINKLVYINLSPEELIIMADSIERVGGVESYKINYYRAFAHFSMTRYAKSASYADSVLNLNIPKEDSIIYFNTYIIKAESLLKLNRLTEVAYMLKQAMSLSKTSNRKDLEANVLFLQGSILRKMNSESQSYTLINEAVDLLKSNKDYNVKLRLSKILGYLSTNYMNDGLNDEAVKVLEYRKQIIDSLSSTGVSPRLLDLQYGYYYAKMAYLSFLLDRRVVANEYYEHFMNTSFSKTPNGIIEINRYLLAIGRFDEVIANNNNFFLYTETEDTASSLYQRSMLESVNAYAGLKDYEWAYYTLEKYNRMILDDLKESDKQLLFELFNEVEYMHFRTDLEDAAKNIALKRRVLFITIPLSIIMLALIIYLYIDRNTLKRRNKRIMKLMLDRQKEENNKPVGSTEQSSVLNRTEINLSKQVDFSKQEDETFSDSEQESDESLFSNFNRRVRSEKLYLNYQLQRDDYAEIMGVDKNHFALIIKEFTGSNLNTYLNNMRLEYSVHLFRTHPEMSISEVGEACALPSSTTFYRLFKEKYGISPKTFRSQVEHINDTPTSM